MATGETTTGSLADALPEVVTTARVIREKEGQGMWQRTTEVQRQTPNTGLNWTEFTLNQFDDASQITETLDNRNFQQYAGTLLSSEPQMTQVIVKATDRLYRKLSSNVLSKLGTNAANAMERKKDKDYLSLFLTFATTCSPGSGQPLSFGHISAAVNNIKSNVTEPSMAEVFSVLHGFQVYDLQTEIVSGVGTYTVQDGLTAEVFRRGFEGTVAGSNVFVDGNITVTATPNANGATHSREAVISIMGMALKTEKDRDMYFGGGADVIALTDEYSFVERKSGSAGTTQVWAYLHLSDATAPAS